MGKQCKTASLSVIRHSATDAVKQPKRTCVECGRIIERGSRCSLHPRTPLNRTRAYRDLCHRIIANSTHCGICGEPLHANPKDKPVVDHVIPRSLGGTDDASNLQAAHRSCNARKSATPPGKLTEKHEGVGAGRTRPDPAGQSAAFRVRRGIYLGRTL
jgi:5-methylcytosine-specific restriction endonuclease McrA